MLTYVHKDVSTGNSECGGGINTTGRTAVGHLWTTCRKSRAHPGFSNQVRCFLHFPCVYGIQGFLYIDLTF